MKVLIALLVLVGATSLQAREIYLYKFAKVERYRTETIANSVLDTPNQSQNGQKIVLKRDINEFYPLLVTAKITNPDTGETIFNGVDLNICSGEDLAPITNWPFFATKFFRATIMPENGWFTCPIQPKEYKINRNLFDWIVRFDHKVPEGKYEISYNARTVDGELVLTVLKYKFVCTDITSE